MGDCAKKIRVCHILNADVYGGIEEQLKILLDHSTHAIDFEFHAILFNKGILATELQRLNIFVHIVPETRLNFFWQIFKICQLLKFYKIQIIHTHKYKENVLGGLAGLMAHVPLVIKTIHGLTELPVRFARFRVGICQKIDHFLTKIISTKVITVSREIESEFAKLYGRNIYYITNAIEIPLQKTKNHKSSILKIANYPKDTFLIGSLGRLEYVKGYDTLIDAARFIVQEQKNVRFMILGNGSENKSLLQQVAAAGLDPYFSFPGFKLNRFDYLNHFDIFVLPSRHEGVPVALLEAMAAGVPVLATCVGGIPTVVQHKFTGILVEPENPLALASACCCLIKDEKLRRCLSNNAYGYVSNNFSANKFRAKIMMLYRELLVKTTKDTI